MLSEAIHDKTRRRLEQLQAFTRQFEVPRGVVKRADGTWAPANAVEGTIERRTEAR